MWQEGDSAIADLLRSKVLGPLERMNDPLPVRNWWSDRGIWLSSTELNRPTLFELAAQCRGNAEPDWVTFLWHVLAWGVVGDYRNAAKIVGSATDTDERARLNGILRTASEASRDGDIRAAYEAIHAKISRLGPAFLSKFLYLTSDRESRGPRCLIFDSRVSAAVFTLTGRDYSKEKAATYEHFCSAVHRWSELFDQPDDVIEFRLYQFGQLIASSRWRWLHAEASLYREGRQHVGFDDIADMRARLMHWKTAEGDQSGGRHEASL